MRLIKKFLAILKKDILAYILLAFGFLLRLFYIFLFTKPESYLWSDAGNYDGHALLMAKDVYIKFSTYWPPFFHIFLSWLYRPIIWLGLEDQRIKIDIIIFALFYILGFWCIYQIVKKLFPASRQGGSEKIALIVLAILVLWYPFIFLNALTMSENLFFPLIFLGLYFLIVKPLKTLNGFWLGLFWGTAVITRPIFALALPLFFIWGWRCKLNWRFLLNFTVTSAVIIISMLAFNSYYTHGEEKSISSSGGFNFAMTWCDVKTVRYTANGYSFWFTSAANINYPDDKVISTDKPFENQKYYYQIGLNCLKEHPERLIDNFSSIKKLFSSTLFPTTTDMAGWENFRFIFKLIIELSFFAGVMTIIGLLNSWIFVDKLTKRYLYLFALIILSLFLTIYFQNVGEERYLIPYSPLLIILAVPVIKKLLEYIHPVKISNLQFTRPYWIWPCYLFLIILSLSIFWFFSVNVKEAYLIKPDGTILPINLPFYHNQFEKAQNLAYKITVNSNINQQAKINIAFDDIIDKISVNDKKLNLTDVVRTNDQVVLNDWKRGYLFNVPLNAGKNDIYIYGRNTGWGYSIKFEQKPFFWIWMLLFTAIGLPLARICVLLVELIFRKDLHEKK